MKRIMIVGCSGSGKSTFAKKLYEKLHIPMYHMDNIFWRENRTHITDEELTCAQNNIVKEDKWIIDGTYITTIDIRLKRATDVFFLDIPFEDCIQGMKDRVGNHRDDLPWLENENDALELIDWNKDFTTVVRPQMYESIKKHKRVRLHIFTSREQADDYLKSLK